MSESHPVSHSTVPRPAATVHDLLRVWQGRGLDAVTAAGCAPLGYDRLLVQALEIVAALNGCGLGRGDRVAVVMPDGPETAVTLLGVMAGATAAPLNPAYRASEFDFYLSDLNVKAVVVQAGSDSAVRDVARARGVAVFEVSPGAGGEAGALSLSCEATGRAAARPGLARPEDTALVLHTSGTTSRPKIVPLTQANVCASAHNIRRALELTPADKCLSMMPLFHVHGIVNVWLSSLAGGAGVTFQPGFDPSRFFAWMEESSPTWYSAVPTMHQAILAHAPYHAETLGRHRLRFVRSSSAPLPPQAFAELERVFGVPIIEAYGMSEVESIASNPLPPGRQRVGSVGVAQGQEVAIMDAEGRLLGVGETGEVVVRGAGVMPGYDNNPAANAGAFTGGYFRTGDQGFMDSDGYLFLTGRLKELINRGGEKISPREVDEVLLEHSSVEQAATFALPHPQLGEEVAAAVVLKRAASLTPDELRAFAAARLAPFKVPRRVLFVGDLPKGPTGKLQRIGLAEKLGLTPEPGAAGARGGVPPRNELEKRLTRIWEGVLGVPSVGVTDDFLEVGGSSLLAARLFSEIEKAFKRPVPLYVLLEASTVEQMASALQKEGWQPH